MNERAMHAMPLLVGLLLAGCASMGADKATQSPPASPQQGRQELVSLQQRIERYRQQLGLPARTTEKVTRSLAAGSDASPAAEAPPSPPPAPASRADAADEASGERPEVSTEDSDRCRYTRAICHAADRICHIADYLGDDDARGRCQQARGDCEEARRISGC